MRPTPPPLATPPLERTPPPPFNNPVQDSKHESRVGAVLARRRRRRASTAPTPSRGFATSGTVTTLNTSKPLAEIRD